MTSETVQIYSIGDIKADLAYCARLFTSEDTLGGINSRHILSLENKFSEITGKNSVLVSSCTNGIYLALKKLNLQGKSVIVPPITFFGVISAIVKAGGIPLYSRVDKYGLMDPTSVGELIDKYPVAAVIPSHINNRYVDTRQISSDVTVIEDAAPVWGITDNMGNCIVSSTKNTTVISFSYGKPLTAGEGGMIITNEDPAWYKGQRYCGLEIQGVYGYGEFDIHDPELKLSSTAIQAALISAKLKDYKNKLQIAHNIAKYYDSVFGGGIDSELNHLGNHQTFVILSDKSSEIQQALDQNGIKSYKSHRPVFWNHAFGDCLGIERYRKTSEDYYRQILHIPCRWDLTSEQVNRIADTVKSALQ